MQTIFEKMKIVVKTGRIKEKKERKKDRKKTKQQSDVIKLNE